MERGRTIRLIAVAVISGAGIVQAGAAKGQDVRGPRMRDRGNAPPANMSIPGSNSATPRDSRDAVPGVQQGVGQAASALPAMAPTVAPVDATPPPVTPAKRAQVSYSGGQLTVTASNSSLNQILHDVSRATGMKITGGIADERVFGNYGPDTAESVLAALLDGTSTNMMLVGGRDGAASELVLTTRTGGVTPPNPNAQQYEANNDDAPAPPTPEMVPQPQPGAQSQPAPSQPAPQAIAPDTNAAPATAPATAPTSGDAGQQQQSPNGVKTPQQIFDELMKLRQQQQQTQH